jgi:hypothetical protein
MTLTDTTEYIELKMNENRKSVDIRALVGNQNRPSLEFSQPKILNKKYLPPIGVSS